MEAQEIAALKKAAIDHPHCSLFPFLLLFHAAGRQDRMQLREHYGINPILLEEWLNFRADTTVSSPDKLDEAIHEEINEEKDENPADVFNTIVEPVASGDYFLQEGINVSSELPDLDQLAQNTDADSPTDQSLMVVMSFSE